MPEIIADNISIINTNELEGTTRIDAEYYQPKYLKVKGNLNHFKPLKFYTENIIHPHEIKRIYSGYGETFLLTQNVRPLRLDFSTEVFIKEQDVQKLSRNILKVGDVLITRTGANFGDTAFYYNQRERIFASSHVLIVRPNASIDGLYLAVFLNTKWGRKMLDRGMYGGLQPEIAPSYLKTIPIPRFVLTLEKDISQKVIESLKYENLANSLYSQAETLLLEGLNIKSIDLSHEPCYEVNSANAISANRIDAEYYQPKYERVIEAIENSKYGWCKLPDRITNIIDKYDPYKEQERNFRYIELSNINPSIGVIDDYLELKGKDLPSRARMLIREGDVIISSVEGSIDKVALVDNIHDGCIASTGFFVFRANENTLPEYALVLCKSILIQKQLEKLSSGTILAAVPKNLVETLIIPDVPIEAQKEIANLIRQSHSARRQAKELLEQAKQKVEEMIEKGTLNGMKKMF